MRNEQGEALAQCQKYNITGINKTQWDESCDWCTMLDAYRLFKRDRQARQGGQSRGIASFTRDKNVWSLQLATAGLRPSGLRYKQ